MQVAVDEPLFEQTCSVFLYTIDLRIITIKICQHNRVFICETKKSGFELCGPLLS